MKKFKFIAAILAVVSSFSFLFGCTKPKVEGEINLYCPDGAPSLAIAKFLEEDVTVDGLKVNVNIVSSANITNSVLKTTQDADVAILPVNAAAKICGTGEIYQIVNVVTHGNLYIVSDQEITLNDLVGKVVGVIGQGLVPDLTLRAVLTQSNIEYTVSNEPVASKVALTYFESGETLMPAMKQNRIKIGLLPEPAATKIVTKLNTNYTYKINLATLFEGGYPQAVTVIKKSLLEEHPNFHKKFTEKLKASIDFANGADNAETVVNLINAHLSEGVIPSLDGFVTADVIGRCSVYFESIADAKLNVTSYLTAIGQNLPSEAFYYQAQ